MKPATERYLAKRADAARWPLQGSTKTDTRHAVVIPALGEYPGLFDTLHDLAANPEALRDDTLVIVVVNNRAAEQCAPTDREANRQTLADLVSSSLREALHLCWVDASAPGNELPPKDGVGLARKIGLDHALTRTNDDAALVCLDADTRVAPDYLAAIAEHFAQSYAHAAVLDYAHPLDGPDARIIADYEIYLRTHEARLAAARSPYAYTAIGSAMACAAAAYVQVGGMNRRQAGEDFYFLQELAKVGRIDRIQGTTLRPSPRPSHRVPFGTGRRVAQVQTGDDAIALYHPESYRILGRWLEVMCSASDPMAVAKGIDSGLADYLAAQNFTKAHANITRHAANDTQRWMQLHRCFDAFRTLKLFHFLRDAGYPDTPIAAQYADSDASDAIPPYIERLQALRKQQARTPVGLGTPPG